MALELKYRVLLKFQSGIDEIFLMPLIIYFPNVCTCEIEYTVSTLVIEPC